MFWLLLAAGSLLIRSAAHSEPTASAPKPSLAIYAPPPDYPHVAYLNGWQGTGIFVMRIQIKTGRVKEVYAQRSTGHRDLDAAAVAALKRWRFQPDSLPPIRTIIPRSTDPLAAEDSLARTPVAYIIR